MYIRTSRAIVLGALAIGSAFSCGGSSDSLSNQTHDFPPLPPSPDTSISILIAQRDALQLSEDQARRFSALESELNARNEPLELKLQEQKRKREQERPEAKKSTNSRVRRGGGRGSRGRGGGGGGPSGGGSGSRGGGKGGQPQQASKSGGSGPSPQDRRREHDERSGRVRAEMMDNNAATLRTAFALLNEKQKKDAARVLANEGHDVPE